MDECFLDTNIVYNYSNHSKNSSCKHIERCYFFIKDETKRFVLCYAVINELNELIKKRARIHKAVIEKINDNNYSFEDSPLISKRDIPYVMKDKSLLKVIEVFEIMSSTMKELKSKLDDSKNLSELMKKNLVISFAAYFIAQAPSFFFEEGQFSVKEMLAVINTTVEALCDKNGLS